MNTLFTLVFMFLCFQTITDISVDASKKSCCKSLCYKSIKPQSASVFCKNQTSAVLSPSAIWLPSLAYSVGLYWGKGFIITLQLLW